jgi:arylsulfatase A-like enzyme
MSEKPSTTRKQTGVPVTPSRLEKTRQQALTRREFLGIASGVLAGGALTLTAPGWWPERQAVPVAGASSRPNILIILTDQERYPQHWPVGWAEANLPNRQRLVNNGLSFRRAFCNSSMCSPSRATLFTGLYPAQHRLTQTLTYGGERSDEETPLYAGIQTIGHMLATAGYHVALKGKWHVSKSEAEDDEDNPPGSVPTTDDLEAFGFHEWVPTTAGEAMDSKDYGGGCANWDEIITDQAVAFLEEQTSEAVAQTPFALVVGLVNPHDLITYPSFWEDESEPGCFNYQGFDFNHGIGLPESNSADDLSTKPTCQLQSRHLYAAGLGTLLTEQQRLNYVNFYAGLQKLVDVQIGRILDAIDPAVLDNTIIIFTTDHGEMGLSHNGLRQKMFNAYEETINIPLVFANSQLFTAPQTTDAFAALVDVMPTLATLADIPNRNRWTFRGFDLSPILADPTAAVQDAILFTFDDEHTGLADGMPTNPATGDPFVTQPNHIRAIRLRDSDGEWLYARYFDPAGTEPEQYEMYHLWGGAGEPVDPHEISNLADPGNPAYDDYSAKRSALAQQLAQLEAERLAPLGQVYLPIVTR